LSSGIHILLRQHTIGSELGEQFYVVVYCEMILGLYIDWAGCRSDIGPVFIRLIRAIVIILDVLQQGQNTGIGGSNEIVVFLFKGITQLDEVAERGAGCLAAFSRAGGASAAAAGVGR